MSTEKAQKREADEPRALPAKRMYRQRAHCNPWSDHSLDYPLKPSLADWPGIFELGEEQGTEPRSSLRPVNADIGCGYGGLLIRLATELPHEQSIGMEIRMKVTDYVQEKIRALRDQQPGKYRNVACVRTNAMKYMVNFFDKGSLKRLFFLYPDPHFKRTKHKWRIITRTLLDIYAYTLEMGGRLYSATDVPELATWINGCLSRHPSFRLRCFARLRTAFVPEQSLESADLEVIPMPDYPEALQNQEQFKQAAAEDNLIRILGLGCTEEAQKAAREQRGTAIIVYERV